MRTIRYSAEECKFVAQEICNNSMLFISGILTEYGVYPIQHLHYSVYSVFGEIGVRYSLAVRYSHIMKFAHLPVW